MKKLTYIFLLSILCCLQFKAQVGIGTTAVNASAALQVSNATNKGVLLPRVDIGSLTNNQSPILNPADGLLVYNLGNTVRPGMYIWENAQWNLLSDSYNIIGNMLLQRSTGYPILGGLANGVYKDFTDANLNVIKNNTGATYNAGNGLITIPGLSGYIVNFTFNITTTDESTATGIAGQPINVHNYTVRLYDPTTSTQYGKTISVNAISQAVGKTHIINVSFTFLNTSSSTVSFMPSVAHAAGGTYQKGSTASDGQITITNMKIDIQRGIFVQ